MCTLIEPDPSSSYETQSYDSSRPAHQYDDTNITTPRIPPLDRSLESTDHGKIYEILLHASFL